jgi:hypothetical protein
VEAVSDKKLSDVSLFGVVFKKKFEFFRALGPTSPDEMVVWRCVRKPEKPYG